MVSELSAALHDHRAARSRMALAAGSACHVVAFRPADAWRGDTRPGRFREELEHRCGVTEAHADTVVIPDHVVAAEDLDAVVHAAAAAAGPRLLVTAVHAALGDLATARDQARELLTLAEALGRGPGFYRFRDLALEYQLTRPSRARDLLAATVAPLRPELAATLSHYFRANGDPNATARAMNLPRGAITTRLGDIARLTGLEPTRPADLWRLHSALVARTGVDIGDDERSPTSRH